MPDSIPRWREDFPVNWEDDHYVTRRSFTTFLTFISSALFLGTGLVALREWWQRWRPAQFTALRIAAVSDVTIGQAKLFFYPTKTDPCLLVRVAANRFVAYSQKCTHLLCPVLYQKEKKQFHCPCHEGYFALEDGRPLAGPPKRPLPRIVLQVKDDSVWATGMRV